jgi:ADP-dependent NAD(P)H-hydrate dehydratase / NAD(P)H-hydrate epimerase
MTPHENRTQDLNAFIFAQRLQRKGEANKGDAGKVLIIGGSHGMSGGLMLSGLGALYCGAGLVKLGMLDKHSASVSATHPELMIHHIGDEKPEAWLEHHSTDVLAIGPGLGQNDTAHKWLRAAIQHSGPLILDADALNILSSQRILLSKIKQRPFPTILTPHPGEAGRLLNTDNKAIQADRFAALQHLILISQAIVVLKGQHTLVGMPEHIPQRCISGNPGMASGGMGDVLTGMIGALCAQGLRHQLDAWEATCLAVQLHAQAGDQLAASGIGPIGMTASELVVAARSLLNQAIHQ